MQPSGDEHLPVAVMPDGAEDTLVLTYLNAQAVVAYAGNLESLPEPELSRRRDIVIGLGQRSAAQSIRLDLMGATMLPEALQQLGDTSLHEAIELASTNSLVQAVKRQPDITNLLIVSRQTPIIIDELAPRVAQIREHGRLLGPNDHV
jgi:hypothetical protein